MASSCFVLLLVATTAAPLFFMLVEFALNLGRDPADINRIYIKRLVEVKENTWAIEETKMNLPKQTMHQTIFNCYLDPMFFYTNKEKEIRTTYERPDIVNGASLWVTPDAAKGFTAIINSFNYEQPGSTARWFNWISSKIMSRDYYFFLKQKVSLL